ncbi:MAG TPA: hypothetical protein VMO75_02015 [Chthoniobacterales bacterium]|jgi:hypothetical protein|nr:hypothetical protein [Chthoniobacterales bacterium]
MNEKKPISGKIELHGNGMGVPSPEDIERRAREIAMIDERNPEDFSDTDWRQAREELLGDQETKPPEEDDKNIKMEEEWEVTPDDHGHRVGPGVDEEDETIGEQLVTDGREEAAHDQMLEARREELEQEGGIT